MDRRNDLTRGSLAVCMLRFSVPYLISCFLQTFYGLADLYIAGRFNGAATLTAVSVGSQLMHMLTVVIVGLSMGATVAVSRAVGAKNGEDAGRAIGNSALLFAAFSAALTVLLLLLSDPILTALSVPPEALREARDYARVCFAGVPLITAYNVLCAVFRGLGDTRRPMVFVAAAGLINIGLDWILIGPCNMGAKGAAIATVAAQGVSVLLALASLLRRRGSLPVHKRHFRPDSGTMRALVSVGAPIALQDGFIQVSFLVITAIANARGVNVAAAVGVVEKIISFLFLVPSAMLSTVSAAAAQNAGAGLHGRGRQALRLGICISFSFGFLVFLLCQVLAPAAVSLFSKNSEAVRRLGAEYLRTYSLDCAFAGIHFCFSGYFSAYRRSGYSFLHNALSVLFVRIPGAWLAARFFPGTLVPMGLAAPMGSLFSALLCLHLYRRHPEAWC